MEDRWIFIQNVKFDNEAMLHYHVDTRDFHCIANEKRSDKAVKRERIKQLQDKFFFTPKEVSDMLERFYTESGGLMKWRMFQLTGEGEKYSRNWQMKYIRIQRTNRGLLVCDQHFKPLSKEVLSCRAKKYPEESD